jgi:NAD-dependent SIR2 family protein deacetylase
MKNLTAQTPRPRKPAAHLIHLIESTKNHHPNFVLFLGAGASAESGVKTAGEMILDWRQTYCNLYGNGDPEAIQSQPWNNTPSEYSQLFEALYDQPSQRREYIENCLEYANPSWGYIYLVDLIRKGVFNTVFTTNFDDLLNEACYLYSTDVRPIVCAHDSSIRSVRITTKRPKIVKLHGDFLFDSIKNTVRELESLENNVREKLRQYAVEYGMIVLGYSGHDRSIMDTLDALLRNDDSFPHGVYWCVRKGDNISSEVDQLCRFNRFHLVEIQGFNGFFSELYSVLSDSPHPIFTNPYGVASEKLGSLLGSLRAPSGKVDFQSSLARDVSILGKSIQQIPPSVRVEMPYQVLAWNDFVQGNIEGAIAHIKNDIGRGLTRDGMRLLLDILRSNWDDGLADDLIVAIEQNKFGSFLNLGHVNNIAVQFLNQCQYDYAERLLEAASKSFRMASGLEREYLQINQAQIFRHRNRDLPESLKRIITRITEKSTDPLARIGAFIVLEEYGSAVSLFNEQQHNNKIVGIPTADVLGWPICKLMPSTYRDKISASNSKGDQDKSMDSSGELGISSTEIPASTAE